MSSHCVDEYRAAEYIGMSVHWLRASRSRGTIGTNTPAPPWLKFGHSVRYDLRDLDTWLQGRRIESTPEARALSRRGAA
jgi:hypothetical protein